MRNNDEEVCSRMKRCVMYNIDQVLLGGHTTFVFNRGDVFILETLKIFKIGKNCLKVFDHIFRFRGGIEIKLRMIGQGQNTHLFQGSKGQKVIAL